MLSVPFFAFFSKKAYREVGKNWRGVNLGYLFLLLAVCCLPPALIWRNHLIQSLESNQTHLLNQLPDIQISNGQVIVDQHQPYYITRKDGTPAVIIDTTGSMNYIADPHVVALLMESSLIVRSGKNTFNTIDLSGVTDFHLTKNIAAGWIQMTHDALVPLSYGLLLLLSYIFAVIVMVLAAVFGLILAKVMHGTMRFTSALRIATVAATPSIIFITISAALGVGISLGIHLAVTLIYLVAGIKVCAQPLDSTDEAHVDLTACLHEEAVETRHAA